MIKINLLGSDNETDIEGRLLLGAFAFIFLLSISGAIYFTSMRSGEVERLEASRKVLDKQLTELAKKTKLVRELEEKKDLVKQKLGVIAKLKKSKIGPVRVMDDLNISLPPRVWILEVAEDKAEFRIVGRALGNRDIAVFMKNLGNSDYFNEVELEESRQMYYDKRTGDVKSTKPMSDLKGRAFGSKKGKKVIVEDPKDKDKKDKGRGTRQQEVDPAFAIKEFVLKAKVNYAGHVSIEKGEKGEKGKAEKEKA